MKYKAQYIILVTLTFLAGFLYFQLEDERTDLVYEVKTPLSDLAPVSPPEVDSTCPLSADLNAELMAVKDDLLRTQQELILMRARYKLLSDSPTDICGFGDKPSPNELLLKKQTNELNRTKQQYAALTDLFAKQNKARAEKSTQHITKIRSVASGVSITAIISPLIAAAKLLEHGESEITNYCADIEEVIALDIKVFGVSTSLTPEALKQYTNMCQKTANQ